MEKKALKKGAKKGASKQVVDRWTSDGLGVKLLPADKKSTKKGK